MGFSYRLILIIKNENKKAQQLPLGTAAPFHGERGRGLILVGFLRFFEPGLLSKVERYSEYLV